VPGAFSRTELLLGEEAMERLAGATVGVYGLGGVGSWVVETLARSGVGGFLLVDSDAVDETNINRQCVALRSTLGEPKSEVMRARVLDINPAARIEALMERFGPETSPRLLPPGLSYAVDAIDSVSAKVELAVRARALGVPLISSMGAGNKLDPSRLEMADIRDTSVCPLARVMRGELKKRGIESLAVVYSREPPIKADAREGLAEGGSVRGRRSVPGSAVFVPMCAGLLIASRVVRDLIGEA
jgi:tRNA threonylcarbamoyladenosine dehydratase